MSTVSATWSRLVRFVALEDGEVHYGEPVDTEVDVGLAYREGSAVKLYEIEASHPWDESAQVVKSKVLTLGKLLSPLTSAETGTIRCTGLSYKDHAEEMGLAHPAFPVQFLKPQTALTDPETDVTVPFICQNEEVDWEVELCVVIGKDCKDVAEEDALDYVLGYTVANDITARKHQAASSQWCHAKSFDGFCPLGPTLVSKRAIPDPHVLKLKTHVNGNLKQNGSADLMIFPIAHVVSFLSQGSTLPAGTIIITGTPPGIGAGLKPAEWLKDGDDVQVWISHGLGTLSNKIVYQKKAAKLNGVH